MGLIDGISNREVKRIADDAQTALHECRNCPRGQRTCWSHGHRGRAIQAWKGKGPGINRDSFCNATSGEIRHAR